MGYNRMPSFITNLFGQLLVILVVMTLVFVWMWVNLVRKRRALILSMESAEKILLAMAAPYIKLEDGIPPSPTRLLEKIAADPELSRTREFKEWRSIADELPGWLKLYSEKIRSESSPESNRHSTFAEWMQLGRGSLLMATIGSATACIGVLLLRATSDLQLFSLLGIAIAITGLQIMYAAAPFGNATAPTSADTEARGA